MCIICVKPYGVEDFTEKVFSNCWSRNDDGAGFAYWDPEKSVWVVEKGIMKLEDLNKIYFDHKFTKDHYVIVHFRIGTSGLMDAGNTHPFEICENLEHMRRLKFESTQIAFHNGTVGKGDKTYSDTMYHIKDYLYPLMPVWNDIRVSRDIAEVVLSEAGAASRWLVCVGNQITRYGKWIDEDGKHYSNDNYKYEYYKSKAGNVIYSSTGKGTYFPSTSGGYGLGPQQPWTHGYSNGEYGFWKDGQFTSWVKYYKERGSLQQETTHLTTLEAEAVRDVLLEIKTQKDFEYRYKVSMGSCGGKFSHIMDWKLFARDMTALRKLKKEENNWREPTEAEKWAMGLNTYTPAEKKDPVPTTTTPDDGPAFDGCPHCFEEEYLTDSPYTIGDTMCAKCGCVFDLATGYVHTYDQDIHCKFVAARM